MKNNKYRNEMNEDKANVTEPNGEVTTPDTSGGADVNPETVTTSDSIDDVVVGIVTGCKKLNVRIKPKMGARVISVVPVNSELNINEKDSTQEWFAVTTSNNIKGFCMKEFIDIKE